MIRPKMLFERRSLYISNNTSHIDRDFICRLRIVLVVVSVIVVPSNARECAHGFIDARNVSATVVANGFGHHAASQSQSQSDY